MKAAISDRFGPPEIIRIEERPTPAPGSNQVLIRQHAVIVSTPDTFFRGGTPFIARIAAGLFRPSSKILGDVVSGEVVAVGSGVTRWKVGDRVFGSTSPNNGAHAEYVVLPEDGALAPIPTKLDYVEAAAIPYGAITALPFLRDNGGIRAGQHVLINGASGAVGLSAVQFAKHFGAKVTAVCSGRHAELMHSLGVDHFLDYTKEDFTRARDAYDIVFDAIGKSSFGRARRALKPGGIYLTTVPSMGILFQILRTKLFGARRAGFAATGIRKAPDKARDMAFTTELIVAGKYRGVVEQTYPFAEIAKAHAHVEEGHKAGDVVVTFSDATALASPDNAAPPARAAQ